MNKFCAYCGSPVDQTAKFCPKCGKNTNSQPTPVYKADNHTKPVQPVSEQQKKQKHIQKNNDKKGNKKADNKPRVLIIISIIAVILVSVIMGVFLVSGNNTKLVEQKVNEDIEILGSGDIKEINHVLFSENIVAEEVEKYIEKPEPTVTEGIFADIISMSEIELVSKTRTNVTFSVSAPDMSSFADEILPEIDADTTEEDLKELIIDYANKSEKNVYEVTLDYTVKSNVVYINYNNPDFLNAITGDFSTGYAEIYKEYILALTEEVPEE